MTLSSGNLAAAVRLPEKEDINEWLAVNTVDFFNQANLIYGSVLDQCTSQSCPIMSAGENFEYLWAEGEHAKKPIKLPAQQYVDHLMTWVQGILDDENVFPSSTDQQFPKNFRQVVRQIFRRLFRVYGHVYYSHFTQIVNTGEEAHLNTAFKHFYLFCKEFDLIEKRELAPLADLILHLTGDKID